MRLSKFFQKAKAKEEEHTHRASYIYIYVCLGTVIDPLDTTGQAKCAVTAVAKKREPTINMPAGMMLHICSGSFNEFSTGNRLLIPDTLYHIYIYFFNI
jgi:hypothetical protein